ncbi:MAG: PAS domain S-box protein [Planctomycetes bacterium]|nr:PAS domain S-box protein [Planctomycetota bacterium]
MDLRPVKVLLITEDAIVVEKVRALLVCDNSAPFALTCAGNLPEGMALTGDAEIGLAWLDPNLAASADLDALDTAARHAPHLPMIALTAGEDSEISIRALRHGAQDCLDLNQLSRPSLIRSMRLAIERKRVSQSLHEADSKWRQIVESAPDIIVTMDRAGTILFINRTVPGLTVEGVTGTSGFEYLPPEHHQSLRDALAQVFGSGQALQYETRATGPHGSLAWYSVRVGPIKRGDEVVAVTLVVTDIGQRKQVEAELRTANEMLEHRVAERTQELTVATQAMDAIIQAAPLAIYTLDPESKVHSWNQAAESIFGWAAAEVIGQYLPMVQDPEHRAEAMRLHERLRAGQTVINHETKRVRKDGRLIDVSLSAALIRDAHGNETGIMALADDITTRKRAEAERQRLMAQVQHGQKLESLGVLTGGIAHDFNNLLTAILGNAGIALMQLSRESPARPTIQEIETASLRAAELVRQMLAYSGKGQLIVQPLCLSRIVEEMAHLLQAVISKKAVLRFDFAAHVPSITGDATQIRQVVMNLITNASDALAESTGVIKLRTGIMFADRDYLSTTYLPQDLVENYYAYLEVADTGCGMDAATMERIFDPFFSTKFTGRGLGLAAVLGIVRGHHGAIKIDSQPGKGTTFRVLFPCTDQTSASSETAARPSEPWRGKGTILVVDDEEVVRTLAARALQMSGFEVIQAADGKQALQIIAADVRLVLVLLDFSMPHMNGDESLRELRKLKPNMAIVLMSGHPESDLADHFAAGDLAGFVATPFRPMEVIAAVRRALEPDQAAIGTLTS